MKIKHILISQPKPESERSPYFDIAKKYNVKIDFCPFVHVEGIPAREFRRNRLNLADYTCIILTCKNAVDHYFRILDEMKIPSKDSTKYFCLTESIAFYLQKYVTFRKRRMFYGNGRIEDMNDNLRKYASEKFLIPVSDVHKTDIPQKLDKFKISYAKAPLYRTVSTDLSTLELNYDLIIFFSPAGVKSLKNNFPQFVQDEVCIGALGPATAVEVENQELRLDLKAPTPEATSITAALEQFLKLRNK